MASNGICLKFLDPRQAKQPIPRVPMGESTTSKDFSLSVLRTCVTVSLLELIKREIEMLMP